MARYCNFQCIIVCMLILVKSVYCLFVDSPHTPCVELYTSKYMKPIHSVVMIDTHTLQFTYRNPFY